jgi:hypothetical protein
LTVADGAEGPLRVVLTWTDEPGSGVQNNLELDVRGPNDLHVPGNAEHRFEVDPLVDDPDMDGIVFDRRNTVEQVTIAEPTAGDYTVRVVATNTPFPPQGYALVAAGAGIEQLVPVT